MGMVASLNWRLISSFFVLSQESGIEMLSSKVLCDARRSQTCLLCGNKALASYSSCLLLLKADMFVDLGSVGVGVGNV
jgi:hypothetical protein